MLRNASAIKGYAIAANDGRLGTVSDFLFDDTSWLIRWLVVAGKIATARYSLKPLSFGVLGRENGAVSLRSTHGSNFIGVGLKCTLTMGSRFTSCSDRRKTIGSAYRSVVSEPPR